MPPTSAELNRKALLPLWIQVFCWLFLIAGACVPLVLLFGGLYPKPMHFALFGWSHDGSPYDALPLAILVYLAASGATAYGLLWGKSWGWDAGIVVGLIGVVAALASLLHARQPDGSIYISLEPALQIPFLYVLWRIRDGWYTGEAPEPMPTAALAGTSSAAVAAPQPAPPILSRFGIATAVGGSMILIANIAMTGQLYLIGSFVFSAGLTLVFLLPLRFLIPALIPWLSRTDQGRVALGFVLFVVTAFAFALSPEHAPQGRFGFWCFWAVYAYLTWYPMFRAQLLPRAIAQAMDQPVR